ncbi:MAG: DHH family phosphoesterase [Alphaproteobacteria bacterium]|nr:DHH family phosphoesterase [Alphaproteobacteria bacterium]
MSQAATLSYTKRHWEFDSVDDESIAHVQTTTELSPIVAKIIASRVEKNQTSLAAFLKPKMKELMPDPSYLVNLDDASARLAIALQDGETIGIFGDYDVDGISASSLLHLHWRDLGGKSVVHVPNRHEGYGPNPEAMQGLIDAGARVIVTLDCGSNSGHVLDAIQASGVDVIVVDHHPLVDNPAHVTALVNAHVSGVRVPDDPTKEAGASSESSQSAQDVDPLITKRLKELCATGVCFFLMVGLNRVLRRAKHFTEQNPEPELLAKLDLVALGTVCDVMALNDLNRVFVLHGLHVMNTDPRPGVAELMRVRKIYPNTMQERDINFAVGPLLNAAGRMSDARIAYQLLTAEDQMDAAPLAELLLELNIKRGIAVAQAVNEALDTIEAQPNHGSTIVVSGNWRQGIVGVMAAQLLEITGHSMIVIGFNDPNDEVGVGSARAAPQKNIGQLVAEALTRGILERGGGHAAAAGLSVARTRLAELEEFASTYHGDTIDAQPVHVEGEIDNARFIPRAIREFRTLAPFGKGNDEPVICMRGQRVLSKSYFGKGDQHFKMKVADLSHNKTDVVLYRAFDRHAELGIAMEEIPLGSIIDISGTIGNVFKDPRRPAMFLVDMRPSTTE